VKAGHGGFEEVGIHAPVPTAPGVSRRIDDIVLARKR
jgi:hypothetical protein